MTAKVLLVGDDVSFMETISNRVSGDGFDICMAEHPDEALALVEGSDFDVAVLNLKDLMAEGTALIRRFKKRRPSMEVITLSVPSAVRLSIESMKLGAFADLVIPFEVDVLIERLAEAFRNSRARRTGKTIMERLEGLAMSVAFAESGEFDTARELAKKPVESEGKTEEESE